MQNLVAARTFEGIFLPVERSKKSRGLKPLVRV